MNEREEMTSKLQRHLRQFSVLFVKPEIVFRDQRGAGHRTIFVLRIIACGGTGTCEKAAFEPTAEPIVAIFPDAQRGIKLTRAVRERLRQNDAGTCDDRTSPKEGENWISLQFRRPTNPFQSLPGRQVERSHATYNPIAACADFLHGEFQVGGFPTVIGIEKRHDISTCEFEQSIAHCADSAVVPMLR